MIEQRCASCHAGTPSQPGFAAAPKGIIFDQPRDILIQAAVIHQQTVISKAMPIGNLTRITAAERELIDRWYRAGAHGD